MNVEKRRHHGQIQTVTPSWAIWNAPLDVPGQHMLAMGAALSMMSALTCQNDVSAGN
jgi:hypothetical protein